VNNNDNLQRIAAERDKALNRYAGLENRNQQFNLLIKQLENLSRYKVDSPFTMVSNDSSEEMEYLRPINRTISKELSYAIMDQESIKQDINSLRAKIDILNKKLSK
jgi:hypothetical protein